MTRDHVSRRNTLKLIGTGAAATALGAGRAVAQSVDEPEAPAKAAAPKPAPAPGDADRERRLKWWHEAKYGMFIHWGLYSVLGRHEWVQEMEAIPHEEYDRLAEKFVPAPGFAREWARLAKRAGQK